MMMSWRRGEEGDAKEVMFSFVENQKAYDFHFRVEDPMGSRESKMKLGFCEYLGWFATGLCFV